MESGRAARGLGQARLPDWAARFTSTGEFFARTHFDFASQRWPLLRRLFAPSGPFASPITGTQALTPAQASNVKAGMLSVSLLKGGNEIRGQVIPSGNVLWTARLDRAAPNPTTFGGAQFVVPADGGDTISYVGAWTGDVQATRSHIHQGGATGSGGVIVGLALTPDGGGLAGTFSRATLVAGDTDGGTYVNVHTTDAGEGLLRGQLVKH